MASQRDPNSLIQKFLTEIGYSFIDDMVSEIKETLIGYYLILEAFKIFIWKHSQKNIEGNK